VRRYSGGMIRRLEIAQSMLHRPSVLFLDEPTVGLDPSAKRAVWERIAELRREFGTTILMTTHDMEEADHLCDMVAVMHRGVLAAMDTARRAEGASRLRSHAGRRVHSLHRRHHFGRRRAKRCRANTNHSFSEWAEPFPPARIICARPSLSPRPTCANSSTIPLSF